MSKGLNPGDTLPDYELPDENGVVHRLSELQGDDFMVVHLSRGEHCPRERQHMRELLSLQEWVPVAYTGIVTIMPNTQHDVFRMKAATGAWWTFLADEELVVQATHEIRELSDTHHDNAVVPHTVVLGPGRVIHKTYCGYWFWGRPSSHQLWADLQDLARNVKSDYDPTVAWEQEPSSLEARAAA
jgi:peroxiredoxin